jgi:CheY-like chemotaxis protein
MKVTPPKARILLIVSSQPFTESLATLLEAAEIIRAQCKGTLIKMITLTVLGRDPDAGTPAETAMFDHFVKPYELDRLLELLAAASATKESRLRLLR